MNNTRTRQSQPVRVQMSPHLTEEDGSDRGQAEVLTSDGHSSAAGQWTVQRLNAVY